MPRVRFSPEFAQTVANVEEIEVDVDGATVGDCLAAAVRRLGRHADEALFRRAGDEARLAADVKVLVDGRELPREAGLAEEVAAGTEIEVAPLKGNASTFDNV